MRLVAGGYQRRFRSDARLVLDGLPLIAVVIGCFSCRVWRLVRLSNVCRELARKLLCYMRIVECGCMRRAGH